MQYLTGTLVRVLAACDARLHVLICVGYVQGMNDLLVPILMMMEDEVDAFWCFKGLMDRCVRMN